MNNETKLDRSKIINILINHERSVVITNDHYINIHTKDNRTMRVDLKAYGLTIRPDTLLEISIEELVANTILAKCSEALDVGEIACESFMGENGETCKFATFTIADPSALT